MTENVPDRVLAACAATWLWLATAFHPAAPWLVAAAIPFGINWAVRTWAPYWWQWFAERGPVSRAASKAWQALPSVLAAAVVVALATGGDLTRIACGAVVGLAAPVLHELLKWAARQLPPLGADGWIYNGGRWPAAGDVPAADWRLP